MVQTARGREGRRDLGHAKRHQEAETNAHPPDNPRRGAAYRADPKLQRGDPTGQDANDGKGNGKIGKPTHPAEQFLRISHALEEPYILRALQVLVAAGRWG